MVTDTKDGQNWQGDGAGVNADAKGTAAAPGNKHGGVATESGGRKTAPDIYKTDVLGNVIKANEDNIYKRGGFKRIKHRNDDD